MSQNRQSDWHENAGPMRVRRSPADIILGLWRAKWLMLAVFLPIFLAGLLLALKAPTTYTASTRLLATLDDFYVYRPIAGGGPAGVPLEQEQVIQAELQLISSPAVAERVLARFKLDEIYPRIAEARDREMAQAPGSDRARISRNAFQAGVEALLADLETGAAPQTPVIAAQFTHTNPETAAELLNATVGAYLKYRAQLLDDSSTESFAAQRRSYEAELLDAEKAIRDFLDANNISDFASEKASADMLISAARSELLSVESQVSAVRAQLRGLKAQVAGTEPQIDFFVEDSSDQTLAELRLEREDLLSRYRPDSRPVQAIDRRIAQAEAYIDGQEGLSGTVRRGPNPVHQELSTDLATLEAQADSLSEQRRELQRQLARLDARQRALTGLTPRWQELQRARNLAEQGVLDYATRESEARARTQLAARNADNIRVIEPARPPIHGSSLKAPIAAVGFLFASFTALMAGLLWAVTRKGFSTQGSLERTLAIPVLAAVRKT
jgi:polysaccharide biosynthesis protein PslE